MVQNWLTETLDIRIPVVQGGMQNVALAPLVAAVTNAGAFGFLSAFTHLSLESFEVELEKTKSLTNKPFGVNITVLPSLIKPDVEGYIRKSLNAGVRVFETAGNPRELIPMIRNLGKEYDGKILILHKCSTVKHALTAERLGADIVSIDGFECAGHPGEDDVSSLILLARCQQVLKVPVLGAGGFANGHGLVAALSLGAVGINMGTRFLCTAESPIHDNVKKAIVNGTENDTNLILRTLNNTSRVYKNNLSKKVVEIETIENKALEKGVLMDFGKLAPLVAGARGKAMYQSGDYEEGGIWACGQAMGLIYDVPTCEELIIRMEKEAHESLARLAKTTGIVRQLISKL
ncbi:inosine monophosphate dehydrogenase [Nadsonia fulvescens var. elongata DSM 6958]|uniref:Inosine monophosphate dehydrogenase n=1 Tax=Nadsonia fulvescens var. elongata DSM 6958 TaxID=857566 RepID=A0A1E3PRA0_9ASCO|nr:inosine monophosphate dehydrogenase [Nadsonia fulvescens var. elongata DSM 6958]